MSNIQKEWIFKNGNAYRRGNLIYIPILKSASIFFTSLFTKNNWQTIGLDEINWDTNFVFGFINYPVTRYIKGLTEDYFKHGQIIVSILEENPKHICLLTLHTLPLSVQFGQYVYKCHWIPIDVDDFSPRDYLDKLCSDNSIKLNWSGFESKIHQSGDDKLEIYTFLKEKFRDGNAHFWKLYAQDLDLYNHVLSNLPDIVLIDPNNYF